MPNRVVKESICTSATLAVLSAEERWLFVCLMVQCDDFGRYFADAGLVRGACLPRFLDKVSDSQVAMWIASLVRAGLIRTYQVGDDWFLQMQNWSKHQPPPRARKSKFPAPDEASEQSTTVPPVLQPSKPAPAVSRQPGKADLSVGFPFLAAYAELTGRKPKQLSSEDVRAAEDLANQERDVNKLADVVAWISKSPFHGDAHKLRSVEKNWPKYEAELAGGCHCGGASTAASGLAGAIDLNIWRRTGQ